MRMIKTISAFQKNESLTAWDSFALNQQLVVGFVAMSVYRHSLIEKTHLCSIFNIKEVILVSLFIQQEDLIYIETP